MADGRISDDLAWWRAQRDAAAPADPAALRDLLARLQAWKAEHDDDRRRQVVPFLQMAWDGVFGDEHGEVVQAIAQIEQVLADA